MEQQLALWEYKDQSLLPHDMMGETDASLLRACSIYEYLRNDVLCTGQNGYQLRYRVMELYEELKHSHRPYPGVKDVAAALDQENLTAIHTTVHFEDQCSNDEIEYIYTLYESIDGESLDDLVMDIMLAEGLLDLTEQSRLLLTTAQQFIRPEQNRVLTWEEWPW